MAVEQERTQPEEVVAKTPRLVAVSKGSRKENRPEGE